MRSLICTLILILSLQNAQATHVMGANISYRCLGGNQYEVSLFVFQNCADPQTASTEIIRAVPSCDFSFASYALSLVNVIEVTQASPQDQENSTCNGGFLPGVVRLTYTDTITISTSCPEMVIFWKKCNRSAAVNVDNTDSPCFYVESVMKTSAGCNNSPQLSSPTVPYVCGDPNINVNLGAFDPDGDELRYSLVAAQRPTSGNNHTDMVYEDGFSPSEPIAGMTIDPNTGNMSLATNIIGFYVVAILVEELDQSDQVKGSMLVDVQFVVSSCSPYPPYLADPGPELISASGADLTEGLGVAVCNGSSFCMDLTFQSDDTEDILNVSANVNEVMPGATLTITGVNPVEVNLCWTAQNLDSDRLLIISVGNNDEPIPTVVSYGLQIINASNDIVELNEDFIQHCGLALELEKPYDYGQWSTNAAATIDAANPDLTYVAFAESGMYEMVWTSGCNSDTLMIEAFAEPLAEAGSDDLNCEETGYSLMAADHDAASWGLWTSSPFNPGVVSFENDSAAQTLVSMSEPGDYVFYWEVSNPMCQMIDSVHIQNGIPLPEIIFEDGVFTVSNIDPMMSYQWYLDGEAILGAHGTTYTIDQDAYGDYEVIVSHSNGCEIGSDIFSYTVSALEETEWMTISISPNPMTEQCAISWADARAAINFIQILDLRGREMHSERISGNSIIIDRGSLSQGVYMVNLQDNYGATRAVKRLLIE